MVRNLSRLKRDTHFFFAILVVFSFFVFYQNSLFAQNAGEQFLLSKENHMIRHIKRMCLSSEASNQNTHVDKLRDFLNRFEGNQKPNDQKCITNRNRLLLCAALLLGLSGWGWWCVRSQKRGEKIEEDSSSLSILDEADETNERLAEKKKMDPSLLTVIDGAGMECEIPTRIRHDSDFIVRRQSTKVGEDIRGQEISLPLIENGNVLKHIDESIDTVSQLRQHYDSYSRLGRKQAILDDLMQKHPQLAKSFTDVVTAIDFLQLRNVPEEIWSALARQYVIDRDTLPEEFQDIEKMPWPEKLKSHIRKEYFFRHNERIDDVEISVEPFELMENCSFAPEEKKLVYRRTKWACSRDGFFKQGYVDFDSKLQKVVRALYQAWDVHLRQDAPLPFMCFSHDNWKVNNHGVDSWNKQFARALCRELQPTGCTVWGYTRGEKFFDKLLSSLRKKCHRMPRILLLNHFPSYFSSNNEDSCIIVEELKKIKKANIPLLVIGRVTRGRCCEKLLKELFDTQEERDQRTVFFEGFTFELKKAQFLKGIEVLRHDGIVVNEDVYQSDKFLELYFSRFDKIDLVHIPLFLFSKMHGNREGVAFTGPELNRARFIDVLQRDHGVYGWRGWHFSQESLDALFSA